MKNKILIVCLAVMLGSIIVPCQSSRAARTEGHSQAGGVPALAQRLAALEAVVIAQAQEIETLKQEVAALKPSPFSETEEATLKGLADVTRVHGDDVYMVGNLFVHDDLVALRIYLRDGEITDTWSYPNEEGWTW